jgi:ketosteroid isomerase-like protein
VRAEPFDLIDLRLDSRRWLPQAAPAGGIIRPSKEHPMRRLATALCALCLASLPAPALAADGSERDAVLKVVTDAYVNGVHAAPNADAMRRGFHQDFRMLVLTDGQMSAVTRDEWAARIEKSATATTPRPTITHEVPQVEIAGHAATVRLELYRDGRHTFTDFLSLYRFADGWKIVGKTFFTHPR